MNKLAYKIEQTEFDDGYKKYRGEGFFYTVDGKKLEYQNYNPAEYYEILESGNEDDPFEDKQMVILNCCTCGMWECDCMAAAVTEKPSTILWQIHKLRDEKIIETYEFDKSEYLLAMQQIKRAALGKKGK